MPSLPQAPLLAALALLLAACSSEAPLLDPARAFACDPSAAGVDTAPPPAPPALSDLPGAPPPAGANGAVTEAAATAKKLFDADQFAEAEPALRRVARGETGDATAARQLAELHLGVALARQNKLDASLEIFLSIAARPTHAKWTDAEHWLFKLALRGPPYLDPASRALAGYPLADRKGLAPTDGREWDAWFVLMHLLGRAWYRAGRYDGAVSFFNRVPPRSEAYELARKCIALICARPSTPAGCAAPPR